MTKPPSLRADRFLVERGFAASRTQAQELIEQGRVSYQRDGKSVVVRKASQELSEDDQVQVRQADGPEFVSRGGLKMQGALEKTKLNVRDFLVLDVGISTGGFTDCLLQAGARKIVGVDVGHGQLAAKLAGDKRVVSIEGVNARELRKAGIETHIAGQNIDLIVIDVSFISLTLVLPEIIHYLNSSGKILALVKPQFEVGRENLGKNGIVKDAKLFDEVRNKISDLCRNLGLTVEDYFASPIEGSDGNKEFFIFARK